MIHITTAANENYAPGLLVTVSSMLTSINPDVELTLHFLNGGVSPATMNKMRYMCSKLHGHCTLVDIPMNDTLFTGANLGPGNSYMAYARLLMGSLIKCEKVIYIDSDIVILLDLAELWDSDMQGAVVLGCVDRKLTQIQDDCPLDLKPEEKERPYFNSGFILVNLNRWREMDIDNKSLEIAKSYYCTYHDQTILNYLLRNDFQPLDVIWNWQTYNPIHNDNLVIGNLHFIEKLKPWLYFGSNLKHRIWRFYYSKYAGSLTSLYASKNGVKGMVLGIKERLVRYSPLFRRIYFNYLRRLDEGHGNVEGIIKFYGNDSLKIPYVKERQIFSEFRKTRFPRKVL
jgi:lipopolysaccharide biosynthesis glycosyltransferase